MSRRLITTMLGATLAATVGGCGFIQSMVPMLTRPSLTAYLGLPANDSVAMVSLTDRKAIGQIAVGDNPVNLALNPLPSVEYLYTANENDGTVSFVNLRTAHNEISVAAGARPWGIGVTPGKKANSTATNYTQWIVVANPTENTVTRIDPPSRSAQTIQAPVSLGYTRPHAVVTVPPVKDETKQVLDAYIISDVRVSSPSVGCYVWKINGDGSSAQVVLAPEAVRLWKGAITPDGSTLLVTDLGRDKVVRFSLNPFAYVGDITIDGPGSGIAISQDPAVKLAYVSIPTANGDPTGKVNVIDYSSTTGNRVNGAPVKNQNYAKEANGPTALMPTTSNSELWVVLQNHLGYFGGLDKVGGTKGWLNEDMQMVPYTTTPGQAPPISDIVLGAGIQ